jgi:hypothetical protein
MRYDEEYVHLWQSRAAYRKLGLEIVMGNLRLDGKIILKWIAQSV